MTAANEPPVIAATGHRPHKLGGYEFNAPKRIWIRQKIRGLLELLEPQYCISGMALGVDQDFAWTCVEMQIPFVAAVPFEGQEFNWPTASQEAYRQLLSYAYCKFVTCGGGYSPHKMQIRNRWMVDNSDVLIAVWDGSQGGTYNCVEYAMEQKTTIARINPNHFPRTA